VYAINPYDIPRGHWKWAGISESAIPAVQPVWLQTTLRERPPLPRRVSQKNSLSQLTARFKNKGVVKKLSISMYNKKGMIQHESVLPSFDVYC
jgi:hypothetical protein